MAMVEGRNLRWRIFISLTALSLTTGLTLLPVAVVVLLSLHKGQPDITHLWPDEFSLEHWRTILTFSGRRPVLLWLWNSTKIGLITAVIVTPFTALSAYALARLKFRGRQSFTEAAFLLQGFPSMILLFAFYALLSRLAEYLPMLGKDSHGGLIFIYCGGILSGVWLLRGYFQTIDPALEEAAVIDGASRFQIFRHILLPLCLPILGIQFIFTVIGTFGDFLLPRNLLDDDALKTVAVGMPLFQRGPYSIDWGPYAATAVLASVPIVLLFQLCQKGLISGLGSGANKG